jgi:hypothetical protein
MRRSSELVRSNSGATVGDAQYGLDVLVMRFNADLSTRFGIPRRIDQKVGHALREAYRVDIHSKGATITNDGHPVLLLLD